MSVAIAGITVKLATTRGAIANRAHNACNGNGKLHALTTELTGGDGEAHTVGRGAVIVHRSSPEDV